jgi:hypothetical protein
MTPTERACNRWLKKRRNFPYHRELREALIHWYRPAITSRVIMAFPLVFGTPDKMLVNLKVPEELQAEFDMRVSCVHKAIRQTFQDSLKEPLVYAFFVTTEERASVAQDLRNMADRIDSPKPLASYPSPSNAS